MLTQNDIVDNSITLALIYLYCSKILSCSLSPKTPVNMSQKCLLLDYKTMTFKFTCSVEYYRR
jgi:hypothetical protein